MKVGVQLIGVKELRKSIERLPSEIQGKALRGALSAGGRVIAKNARKRASKESGALKKSIGLVVRMKSKSPYAVIGARNGFVTEYKGQKRNPAKYAHLVEFGTSTAAAHPFLRPAADESGPEVFDKMSIGIEKAVDRAVRKYRTKGKF